MLLDSKLLVPVVCFSELVCTGLSAVWAEQHASTDMTQFLTRTVNKELNAPILFIVKKERKFEEKNWYITIMYVSMISAILLFCFANSWTSPMF